MNYKGSCHCGKVAYEVEIEGGLQGVMECNCSMCSRKGAKMAFVPGDKLRLTTPDSNAKTYLFNKHVIQHRFCPECGIHAYGVGRDRGGNEMAMINVRCLEGVDYDALPVKRFDGRAL
ncbi:MAG TPA: GFA family protein [Usitatibacter sp.]|jgi:hypothetical protein|nr:GFA family protein [Usitatibacter sp.]